MEVGLPSITFSVRAELEDLTPQSYGKPILAPLTRPVHVALNLAKLFIGSAKNLRIEVPETWAIFKNIFDSLLMLSDASFPATLTHTGLVLPLQ